MKMKVCFPHLNRNFWGSAKPKSGDGYLWVCMIRGIYFWTSSLRSILNADPDSLRNFKAQNLRISQVMKNTTKDSHPGIFTMDFDVIK
jgi:hypothetical protein